MRSTELLLAQGIIPQYNVAVTTSEGSKINDNSKKRTRDDVLLGPSKRYTVPTIKKEDVSVDVRMQRIRDLQVSKEMSNRPLVVPDYCVCRVN
jgi:hypothetical protein